MCSTRSSTRRRAKKVPSGPSSGRPISSSSRRFDFDFSGDCVPQFYSNFIDFVSEPLCVVTVVWYCPLSEWEGKGAQDIVNEEAARR